MTDASVVVGETVELRCGATGRPGEWLATVVTAVDDSEFTARCAECGRSHPRYLDLSTGDRGMWWRKLADRPEAAPAHREVAPLTQDGMHRLKAQQMREAWDDPRYAPPPVDSAADRAMRSKERRELLARITGSYDTRPCTECGPTALCECATALATHCTACGCDLRTPYEQRAYCATCSPVCGNAIVLPIVAPEPETFVAWIAISPRGSGRSERGWEARHPVERARDDHAVQHPLRAEAIRLWREAWVTRERGRIEASALLRRARFAQIVVLMPAPGQSNESGAERKLRAAEERHANMLAEQRALPPPLRHEGQCSSACTAGLCETYGNRRRRLAEERAAQAEQLAHRSLADLEARLRAGDPPLQVELPAKKRGWVAIKDIAAGQLVTEADVKRAIETAPPRMPQVGDEIEVLTVSEWVRMRILRFDASGYAWGDLGNGVHYGVLPERNDHWRWPSEAGT